jgi:predicted permease
MTAATVARLLQVVEICAPLFGLIALGAWLRRRGTLTADAHRFLTWLVYWFSLPLLIFLGVASQDFAALFDPVVLASTVAATVVAGLIGAVLPVPRGLRGPVIVGTFFGNVAYLGFPLAEATFGSRGFTTASVVNAFTMPIFVVLAVALLDRDTDRRALFRSLLGNPILLAAGFGLAASLVLQETRIGRQLARGSEARTAWTIVESTVRPLAELGLPLALLSVGASLRFDALRGGNGLGVWMLSAMKLVVTPALTYAVWQLGFPDAPRAVGGTAALLMATPNAVTFYVLAEGAQASPRFVAASLTTSTLLSTVSLPVWVWVVLS